LDARENVGAGNAIEREEEETRKKNWQPRLSQKKQSGKR
jgi:hypothetical protein